MDDRGLVLVTGGAGFIGAETVRALRRQARPVRVFDNLYRADPLVVDELRAMPGVELVEGDIRYRGAVERALNETQDVVHLAALSINKSLADPEETIDVNLVGSQNVFFAAAHAGVRRVVFASSASVYGEPDALPMTEEDRLGPLTPYCISKLAGEQLLQFVGQSHELDWTALRFFNVYGPGQRTDAYYTSVILTFIERLRAGQAPVIDGDGEQTMDFVHVRDVARAITLALGSNRSRVTVNIGSGEQTSIADLARLLIQALGLDVEPEFRPRDVQVTRRAADVSRAAEVLGWRPEVGLKEGLAEVVRSAFGAAGGK